MILSIFTTLIDIKDIDLRNAIFKMHSIREMSGIYDMLYLLFIIGFLSKYDLILNELL